jgi:peptidoglycan-associated lipoprotein
MNFKRKAAKRLTYKYMAIFFSLFFLSYAIAFTKPVDKEKNNSKLIVGNGAYEAKRYLQASVYLQEYLKSTPNAALSIKLQLADCYWNIRDYDSCLKIYNGLKLPPEEVNDVDRFRIGELNARTGNYQEAARWLKTVPGYEEKAATYMDSASMQKMYVDSACWSIDRININNSGYRLFSPVLCDSFLLYNSNFPQTVDKKDNLNALNFTRLWKIAIEDLNGLNTRQKTTTQLQPDVQPKVKIVKQKLSSVYEGADVPVRILREGKLKYYMPYTDRPPGTIVEGLSNISYNVGAVAVDSNRNIYFTANYAEAKGINHTRLMEGRYNGKKVTNVQALPFGDYNAYSVLQPAVNQEGTLLVFCSNKPDGKGGYDMYYTTRDNPQQSWRPILNLEYINTEGNEVFPCITPDGYLYFSSDALSGLGGLDIYRIPVKDVLKGTGDIEHLSYPINSTGDDFGWTQDKIGEQGYFTSDRFNSIDHIYHFRYEPPLINATAIVREKKNKQPIAGATVLAYNSSTGIVSVLKTDIEGRCNLRVKPRSRVAFRAVINPYDGQMKGLNANEFSNCVNRSIDAAMEVNLYVQQFTIGTKWEIKNIYYDFNKWDIRNDAMPVLDSLVTVLEAYPIVKIELSSHTDQRGADKYNQVLSERRAKSAADYIISKGIESGRIAAKGYGKSRLIATCPPNEACPESVYQQNRRTEVKITGYALTKQLINNKKTDLTKYNAGDAFDLKSLQDNIFAISSSKDTLLDRKQEVTYLPKELGFGEKKGTAVIAKKHKKETSDTALLPTAKTPAEHRPVVTNPATVALPEKQSNTKEKSLPVNTKSTVKQKVIQTDSTQNIPAAKTPAEHRPVVANPATVALPEKQSDTKVKSLPVNTKSTVKQKVIQTDSAQNSPAAKTPAEMKPFYRALEIVADGATNNTVAAEKQKAKTVQHTHTNLFITKTGEKYMIQAGAFSVLANAIQLQRELQKKLSAKALCFVDKTSTSMFYVRIGSFNTYEEASEILKSFHTQSK